MISSPPKHLTQNKNSMKDRDPIGRSGISFHATTNLNAESIKSTGWFDPKAGKMYGLDKFWYFHWKPKNPNPSSLHEAFYIAENSANRDWREMPEKAKIVLVVFKSPGRLGVFGKEFIYQGKTGDRAESKSTRRKISAKRILCIVDLPKITTEEEAVTLWSEINSKITGSAGSQQSQAR